MKKVLVFAAIAEAVTGLGGVDKFEPASRGGEMGHSEETAGQLVVAGDDGAVDLQVTEHAFDAIALLVERAVMLDLCATIRATWNDGLDLPIGKVGTNGVGIVSLVREQGVGRALGQAD